MRSNMVISHTFLFKENRLSMYLKNRIRGCGLDLSGSGQRQVNRLMNIFVP
jgi:hypothetical protein